jgi:integrase
MALDEITVSEVGRLPAQLVATPLSDKRINNILAVLSKALKYAVECEVIAKSPRIGLFKIERPEIVAWDFERYARLLATAKVEGEGWYAAVCLAGEAGLRIGEVKALRWREDVDMIGRTITVNLQTRRGETGAPKGGRRRTVPMTSTVYEALKGMNVVREGSYCGAWSWMGRARATPAGSSGGSAGSPDCRSATGIACGTRSARTSRCSG